MYYQRQGLPAPVSDTKINPNWEDFEHYFSWRVSAHDKITIPSGLENYAIRFSNNTRIKDAIERFHIDEAEREKAGLANLDQIILELEQKMKVKPTKTAEKTLGTKTRVRAKLILKRDERVRMREDGIDRIYPKWMAPVIVENNGKRSIELMRYRILPSTGVEIPSKYNVFNARRDSLKVRRTWKPLFGQKHAIFQFRAFYEWVEPNGKSVEIKFKPDGFEYMTAPILYEETKIDGKILKSFAMVTDDPPPEVLEAGHDRCPIFLTDSAIDQWLQPNGKSQDELDQLFDIKETPHYSHSLVA